MLDSIKCQFIDKLDIDSSALIKHILLKCLYTSRIALQANDILWIYSVRKWWTLWSARSFLFFLYSLMMVLKFMISLWYSDVHGENLHWIFGNVSNQENFIISIVSKELLAYKYFNPELKKNISNNQVMSSTIWDCLLLLFSIRTFRINSSNYHRYDICVWVLSV